MRINSPVLTSLKRRLSWDEPSGRFAIVSGALLVASIIAFVIFNNIAQAGMAVIVPNGDTTVTGWSTTGTNDASCAAATICDFIDESNAAPDTTTLANIGATETGEWALSTFTLPAGVTVTDSVTVGIYANAVTIGGAGADTYTIALKSGGATLGTSTAQTPTNGSYSWRTATFTGSWTQTQIDGMSILITRTANGSGNLTTRRDAISFSTMYAQVDYTTPITYNQSSYRWFDNSATPLAAQNTVATPPVQGTPFRLRFLLTIGAFDMPVSTQAFKLQVAPKSGSCSASTYADLSATTGDIRYYDNTGTADGSTISGNANDPTYLSSTKRPQTYVESASFTNSVAQVAVGESGLWEISLVNNRAPAGNSYCFRVVKSNNSTLNTYTQYPEITIGTEPDTGRQFKSDHTTSITTGSTIVGSSSSQAIFDFNSLPGSTVQTMTPQIEIKSTSSSFTGTPTHSAPAVSATFAMPPLRMQTCSAYDPVGKRMIVFGGQGNTTATHYNDVWALNLPKDSPATWTQLIANGAGGSPAVRRGCTMTYDSTNNRMVMFGGRITGGSTIVYNDVWTISLGSTPAFTQLCNATSCGGTAPSTRTASNMIYDATGNQIILFGGYTGSVFTQDTWRLTLGGSPAWTSLTPSGGTPSGRAGHSFEFDPVNRLGWMTMGTSSTVDANDLWKYDVAANSWTQIYANNCSAPTCPTPLDGASMVYDSVNQRMVVFGGYNWNANPPFPAGIHQTTFILSNLSSSPTWSQPSITSAIPHGRFYAASDYDPENQRMIVFAGENYALNPNGVNKDLSALYLPSGGGTPYWRSAAVNYSWSGRDQSAPYYDSTNRKLYLFGGFANGTLPQTDTTGTHVPDTFMLDLQQGRAARWRNVNPQSQLGSAAPPIAREAVAFAKDTSRNRMIVFGGLHEGYTLNDTWVMTPGDGTTEPTWTQLCTATSCGTAPTARWLAYAIYDSTGDRFIVFGGEQTNGTDLNDVWALSLSGTPTWTQLSPGGSAPSIRFGGAAVFDSTNNRMVIWGGQSDPPNTVYNTTHALSLGGSPTWSTLSPTGSVPTGRRSMGYALANIGGANKMIIFGGYTITSTTHYNEISILDLSTTNGSWTTPYASNCSDSNAPACRRSTIAVYEPTDNAVIVGTGRDATQFFGDMYQFNITGSSWTNLDPITQVRYSVPISGLADGAYHWQYRITGSSSGSQAYRSFSNNSDTPTAGTDVTFCIPPTVDNRMRLDTFFCANAKQNKYL